MTFSDAFSVESVVAAFGALARLPDLRLEARLRTTARMLVERLEAPTTSAPRAERVGAQRFWNNDRIDPDVLTAAMLDHQASRLAGHTRLILVHDTCEIDRTGRGEPDDAGPLRSNHARGYLMHWALAVDPASREPLAALACDVWTRPWKDPTTPAKRNPDPEQRESAKWRRGIRHAVATLARGKIHAEVTHVVDREGDTHENLEFAQQRRLRLVARNQQDREIEHPLQTLWALLDSASVAGTGTLTRRVSNHPRETARKAARAQGRAELKAFDARVRALGTTRNATLELVWSAVKLTPDSHKKKRRKPVTVWAVQVKETQTPPELEPVHWRLLTTIAVHDEASAQARVDEYLARWPIEPMHQVLKTGLHLEQDALDSVAAEKRHLAVLLPLALHLVRWSHQWQADPFQAASEQVPAEVIDALKGASRYHELPLPRRRWTLQDVVLRLAELGGYERRPDRSPGWLVLWRGWRELQRFIDLVQFVKASNLREVPPTARAKLRWKKP
jgi:hypothetical protein